MDLSILEAAVDEVLVKEIEYEEKFEKVERLLRRLNNQFFDGLNHLKEKYDFDRNINVKVDFKKVLPSNVLIPEVILSFSNVKNGNSWNGIEVYSNIGSLEDSLMFQYGPSTKKLFRVAKSIDESINVLNILVERLDDNFDIVVKRLTENMVEAIKKTFGGR